MLNWRTHPEESELIRYCDGELRAREAERISRHLEACWDCRTRLDDLKQTIAEYVRYQRDVLERALPTPPQPWKNLPAEFARIPARRRIFPGHTVWLVAGAATATTGIVFYRANAPKPAPSPAAIVRPAPAPTVKMMPRMQTSRPVARMLAPGPEDELRVIAALDRIGAGLGDPIDVVRTSDGIVVTCIGLSGDRLREVRAAVTGMPGVTVELSTKPAAPGAASPLEVVGGPLTTDDPQVADELLRRSESMMARAHALRHLAMRFPVGEEENLSAEGKALLASLRQRHEKGLARETIEIVRALGGLPPAPATHGNEDWQTHTMRVFAEAEQVDRLLGGIYGSNRAEGAGDRPALMAALAKLQADVQ